MKLISFKVVSGQHVDENKKVFKQGDVVKSIHPLDKIFRNKFERVGSEDLITDSSQTAGSEINLDDLAKKYGENVTKDFPNAVKLNLLVYKKTNWYMVLDGTDGSILSDKKLRADQLAPFINQYLEN